MVDPARLGPHWAEQRTRPLLRTMIGDALRRARLRQGRTLADVARDAKVSMPYLSELERGRKEGSSEILAAICGALGIDLADLLAGIARRAGAVGGAAIAGRATGAGGYTGPAIIGRRPADRTGDIRDLTADHLGPADVIRLGDARDDRDQAAPLQLPQPLPQPLPAPPAGPGDAVCRLAA